MFSWRFVFSPSLILERFWEKRKTMFRLLTLCCQDLLLIYLIGYYNSLIRPSHHPFCILTLAMRDRTNSLKSTSNNRYKKLFLKIFFSLRVFDRLLTGIFFIFRFAQDDLTGTWITDSRVIRRFKVLSIR